MPQFTWVSDIPSGVLKNHALSDELVEAAIQELVFFPFTTPVEGFGAGRGETVSWPRVHNMAEQTSIVLLETERVPEHTVAITTRGSTVQEIGAAVPCTNLAKQLTVFDLENALQRRLKDNLALGLDTLVAQAFKDTQIRCVITGLTAQTISTNGVFAATSTANLNTVHIEDIVDYLSGTLYAAPYADGEYVGITNTKGMRGIKRDPNWADWHKRTNPAAKYRGEVGTWERARMVETNHAAALANVGTGNVLGETVFFGYDPVKYAEAMAPELRAGMAEDLGRSRNVGFYGIIKFTSTWGDRGNAGEANVLYVGSL